MSRNDFTNSNANEQSKQNELDMVTKNLNKLARQTPEGYMIIIEQRQFEGRENLHIELKNPNAGNNTTIMAGNKSVYGQSEAAGTSGFFVKN